VLFGSRSNNILSSHAKVIAGAVIGSVFGVIIILLAITATLQKSNFMRKRLGLRWKELNDAEGKDPANLTLPGLPVSRATLLERILHPNILHNRSEPSNQKTKFRAPQIQRTVSDSITPGSSRASAFQQSPPVYSPGARASSPQSPRPSQNSVPAEMKPLRNVKGKSRQWV
jgi:hypothetical protein